MGECLLSQRELAIGLHIKINKVLHDKENTKDSSAI